MTDDTQMHIQWYPGHMTKTRRQMEENLKQVDAVCEILDARIPYASRNPDIATICGSKPRMVILNRMDMADSVMTNRWSDFFKAQGLAVLQTDCKSRRGVGSFNGAVRELLREKLERYQAKGQLGRALRVMIVGIPNVGKSTFINQVSGRNAAKAENRPGVTRGKQWVNVDRELLLLDTPGILWPKFDDARVGLMLAYTGAIKDDVLDIEGLACSLSKLLWQRYPDALQTRYGIDLPAPAEGFEILEAIGRRRGFLISGGEIDFERASKVLIDEYRTCKLGRFTLEGPELYEVQP